MINDTSNSNLIKSRIIVSIILCLIGIGGSIFLKVSGVIGEPSLLILVGFSCLIGFAIAYSPRIELLDIKNLSIKLYEMKTIQNDVIAREEHIRKTALLLGEITLFSSTTSGMLFTPEIRELRRSWFESKVKELMSVISVQPEEHSSVFKFLSQFKETYTKGTNDPAKAKKGWEKFWRYASDDIEDKSPNK